MTDKPETVAIPVVEEQLRVGYREVESDRVRVRTVTDERTEVARGRLHHSEIEIERVRIDREVTELPTVREEEDTVIVPIVEERLVKRLFLVEEVRLHRRVTTEDFEHPVTLRTQRAVVERAAARGDPGGRERPGEQDRRDGGRGDFVRNR